MMAISLTSPTYGRRLFPLFFVGVALLLYGVGWSLFVASEFDMGWQDVADLISGSSGNELHQIIIMETRLPRALNAMGAGAALALAGLLMQSLTRNPLASPSVFGVSAGAAFAFAFASTGLLPWLSGLPVLVTTFLGACLSGIAVFFLAGLYLPKVNNVRVVLAGVALNFLFISLTRAAIILADENAYGVLHWLTGSVGNTDWSHVSLLYPPLIAGLLISVYISFQLNLMSLGEEMLKSLGGQVWKTRTLSCITIVLLIAAAVAVAGPLAFIGLIVPHLARAVVGHDIRILVPFVALGGALLLVYADAFAQLWIPGREHPVGIVTSLIGACAFLIMVRSQVRRGYA